VRHVGYLFTLHLRCTVLKTSNFKIMFDVLCMEFTAWFSTIFLLYTKFVYFMLLCLASSAHIFRIVVCTCWNMLRTPKLVSNGNNPVYSQHFCGQDTPTPCIIQHKALLKSASWSNYWHYWHNVHENCTLIRLLSELKYLRYQLLFLHIDFM
jgi:hypothetical protein